MGTTINLILNWYQLLVIQVLTTTWYQVQERVILAP